MKNVIGPPARGVSFFPRTQIVNEILALLETSNLQIVAPRRIGKTSILFFLLDKKLQDHIYVYVDTEAVDEENEFFKKVLKEILRSEAVRQSSRIKKFVEQGNRFLKRIKSIHVLGQEVAFEDNSDGVDYKEDLLNLLIGLELDDSAKLVILLDEFPQTIQNILDRNNGNSEPAKKFLQSNREIRLHPEVLSKVKFIITGSIGLNHTVAAVECSAFINDLASLEVGPLSKQEAADFLQQLLTTKELAITAETSHYLFDRLEWLIPFHIQLAVQEIMSMARLHSVKDVTPDLIDQAFHAIIQARNNNHFEHYYSRLRKQFKGSELEYVRDVLDALALSGTIKKAEIFGISAKHDLQSRWRTIIEVLVYDGYINNIGDHNVYRFNSPIVRMWWQKFICK